VEFLPKILTQTAQVPELWKLLCKIFNHLRRRQTDRRTAHAISRT